MKTIALMSLLMIHARSSLGSIERIGNPIQASSSGSHSNRTAFLLIHEVPQHGVVFAFSAFFLYKEPVQFQIWRPQTNSNQFKLVGGWTFTPVVEKNLEIMYIHTRQGYKCAEVKKGDRLGLYTVISPGAVAYNFDTQQPSTKSYTLDGTHEYIADGTTVPFDLLVYPYKFSVAAFIDTDMSKYQDLGNIACPSTLVVPSETVVSTLAPVTPVPGKQGATGEAGKDGAQGATGPRGAQGPWGGKGETGMPGQPGATGPQGPVGHTGKPGPRGVVGATGVEGPKGDKGDNGYNGTKGDTGPPGPVSGAQQSSLDALLQDCSWCQNLVSPYLSLVMLIWLIVISIVFVIVVIFIRRHHRNIDIHYQKGLTSGTSQNELWKKYHNTGFDNDGNNINYVNDEMYAHIDEGRTEF